MNGALKTFVITLLVVLVNLSARAVTDYATLEGKAERFYRHKEWSSALAMYQLMLDQRPTEIPVYAYAIVTSGMMKKPEIQFELKQKVEKMGLPIDSIFAQVSRQSFAIYHPEIYEEFLIMLKDKQSWLVRVVNTHLLKYYTFRNDPNKMIAMAQMLLKSTPDNVSYLQTMGDAYCLKGNLAEGMEWYKKVLDYEPRNYQALLELGNYYNIMLRRQLRENDAKIGAMLAPTMAVIDSVKASNNVKIRGIAADALSYLARAYNINATPYVENMMINLNKIIAPPMEKKKRR